jgi:hypothetical protein
MQPAYSHDHRTHTAFDANSKTHTAMLVMAMLTLTEEKQ